MRLIDLSGMEFGRLRVLRRAGAARGGSVKWLCVCAVELGGCGAEHTTTCENLKTGKCQSCGCFRRSAIGVRSTKHSGSANGRKTPEYQVWRSMRSRCYRRSNKAFANYGGRGITVCDRWRNDFSAFLADMGPRPSPKHSVDRIDNDGPYSPENCRWATDTEQARNCRKNVVLEFNGQRRCVAEWSEITGISYVAIRKRIKRGWSVERALSAPCAWPVVTTEVKP